MLPAGLSGCGSGQEAGLQGSRYLAKGLGPGPKRGKDISQEDPGGSRAELGEDPGEEVGEGSDLGMCDKGRHSNINKSSYSHGIISQGVTD